jgi:NAD(P)-dependent dehydrogenase (short-subunit alcohol dehydrogenase family)
MIQLLLEEDKMSKVSVKNLILLVTGTNRKRGIGRALVEEAIKRGAKKVYACSRDVSQLEDLIAKFHEKVVAVELDVTNQEQIKKVAKEASDAQILINNAGVAGLSGYCFN